MIAVSALLAVAAVVLLARGVLTGLSDEYLYASIVTSAVAALALIVAVRRPVPLDDDFDVPVRPPRP